jgi:hypothetical protein
MSSTGTMKRWRLLAGGVLLAAVLAVGLGGMEQPRRASEVESVESQRFLLRDAQGRLRAELSVQRDDAPKLWFYGEQGERRIELSLLAD